MSLWDEIIRLRYFHWCKPVNLGVCQCKSNALAFNLTATYCMQSSGNYDHGSLHQRKGGVLFED